MLWKRAGRCRGFMLGVLAVVLAWTSAAWAEGHTAVRADADFSSPAGPEALNIDDPGCSVMQGGFVCGGQCADTTQKCHPREVLADAEGNLLEITCCACDEAGCQMEIDPASGRFFCTQNPGCGDPDLQTCRLIGQGNPDGTISYSCDCVENEQPAECAYVEECNANCPGTCVKRCSGVCPDPAEACMPLVIAETIPGAGDFRVTECACDLPTSELCRPVVSADGTVECHGECPDPNGQCELIVTPAADGVGQEYRCEPCNSEQEIGACCYVGPQGNHVCAEMTEDECKQDLNGTYFGDGTTCGTHAQHCYEMNFQQGACCYRDLATGLWTCASTTHDVCTNSLNGTYHGDFSTCTPDLCPPNAPTGACCYQDITGAWQCTEATAAECRQELQGMYHGDGSDCDTAECPQSEKCNCIGRCDDRNPTYDDAAYAAFTDEVAVATEWSQLGTDPVLVNIDIKNRYTAPLNANWTVRTNTRYSHATWSRDNLGTIFGVALDRRGHTYVTQSTSYYLDNLGLLPGQTWGSVIRVDASSALPAVFANLPNTGPGLGNICYDGDYDQFFVSNFEDGRIYRLSATGGCLGTFDHATGTISASCAAEAGDAPGFAPLGERVWGLQVYNGRLYYGIWAEDLGRSSLTDANTIHSIALVGGNFSGAPALEIVLPPLPGYTTTSMPPADIAFSDAGCMLVAERGMGSDEYPYPHASRVLEYRQALSGTWWPSAYTFDIGSFSGSNSAGGVDYDREGNVWATGDALQFSPLTVYGLQSLPCTGGDVTGSVLVDLNGIYSTADKTQVGDVEIGCNEHCVAPPKRMSAWFPLDEPASATVADEIVWDRDGVFVGTTTVPGMVAAARRFNGNGDVVRVPNAAQHNFGTGDFSIDAWVRSTAATGVQVMVEKRQTPTRGWSLYLYNGQLGFQLGDGVGFSNWVRPGFIADGVWHHVAATVDRDNPTGLLLFVDGVPTAYNPTIHPGSVTTTSNLWIGAREPAFGQVFFRGDLDEIELFPRVLAAAEVQGLYNAGKSGKCKDRCVLPRRVALCKNKSSVVVNLTICNDSAVAHNYLYYFFGNANCTWAGPTGFSPFIGIVNVAGNSCVTVPVTVTRPAGMPVGYESCFNVNIFNLDTGHTFGCEGSIYTVNKWCFIIIHGGPIGVPIGLPKSVGFDVGNDGDEPADLHYTIRVEPDGVSTNGPGALSLNGLPPGEPVLGEVSIAPGASGHVDLTLSLDRYEPFRHYEVVVYADDGARALDEIGAFTVQGEITCGDFDRDGEISAPDGAIFQACLAGPGTPPAGACPELVDADCDGDADVDLRDFAHLQEVLGTVLYTP